MPFPRYSVARRSTSFPGPHQPGAPAVRSLQYVRYRTRKAESGTLKELRATSSFGEFVRALRHRMEDEVLELCEAALAENDPKQLRRIHIQLRDALHKHIEAVRKKLVNYPIAIERRTHKRSWS